MTALPEGFVPHDGGPCPIQGVVGIEVIIRAGIRGIVLPQAIGWDWSECAGEGGQIIAYRPTQQETR
jgi:hypothetical protein